MWNNKVDRIIWILGSVKTTNEKMFLLPVFYNMDNGQGLPKWSQVYRVKKDGIWYTTKRDSLEQDLLCHRWVPGERKECHAVQSTFFVMKRHKLTRNWTDGSKISGWLLSSQYSIVKMSSYLTACVSERWRWTLFRSIYRTFKGTVTGHPAGVLTMKQ